MVLSANWTEDIMSRGSRLFWRSLYRNKFALTGSIVALMGVYTLFSGSIVTGLVMTVVGAVFSILVLGTYEACIVTLERLEAGAYEDAVVQRYERIQPYCMKQGMRLARDIFHAERARKGPS